MDRQPVRNALFLRVATQGSNSGISRATQVECPFVPGQGILPPFLAGREVEQRAVANCLDSIQAVRTLESDLVLFGPRGHGKTAMLLWIQAEARARGIATVIVSAGKIDTERDLVARLPRPRKWTERLGSISWKGLGWKSSEREAEPLDQTLAKHLRKAPLALLIDEAHVLDASVGLKLLSAVQELRGQGAPLLFALAGTPGLLDHLRAMQATFWERSEILPFERLEERDSGAAIRVPFEAADRTIGPDALEKAVTESQGYPYFLQIWGKALWVGGANATEPITPDDLRRAYEEFSLKRNRFYGLRYRELERLGLEAAAIAVADAYAGRQQLRGSEINDVLEETLRCEGRPCDAESVAAIRSRLVAVGYVWDPGSGLGSRYVQGIPSLMDFVLASGRSE